MLSFHGNKKKYRQSGTVALLFIIAVLLQSCGPEFSIVTTFDRDFTEKWMHVPSGSGPVISRTDTVYPGIPVALEVFFRKYARNDSGRADLSFSYTILSPEGEPCYDTTGITGFAGAVDADTALLLSRSIPAVTFSEEDAFGTYRIRVTVEDRIAGRKKTEDKAVVLTGYPAIGRSHFDVVSFNVWLHSYCITPDPGRAVAAFSFFINSKLSNDDAVFWPVFYFFQCLFHENPGLAGQLVRHFPGYSGRLREYTVLLLRAIRFDRKTAGVDIPETLWKRFDDVADEGFLDPFAVTFRSGSCRLMEFGFYYYGRYRMIRFLIDCLGLTTPAGFEAFYRSCEAYGGDCLKTFSWESARRLHAEAVEILKKSCAKHLLVQSYCRYAFERDDLQADVKRALGELLSADAK